MSMIKCEEAISFKLRKIVVEIGRHDIQYNDIQHKDI